MLNPFNQLPKSCFVPSDILAPFKSSPGEHNGRGDLISDEFLLGGQSIHGTVSPILIHITNQPGDVVRRCYNLHAMSTGTRELPITMAIHAAIVLHNRLSAQHSRAREARVSVTLASIDSVVKVQRNTSIRLSKPVAPPA
jgi:hypothetical protein